MRSGALEVGREALSRLVLDIPDHPEPGVVFKDITPVLSDPDGLAAVVAALTTAGLDEAGAPRVDVVVGMEARGFILAPPVALALGAGFVPVRKAGKLPRETHAVSYDLEYGSATLELHRGAGADLRCRGGGGRGAAGPRLPALAPGARRHRCDQSAEHRVTPAS